MPAIVQNPTPGMGQQAALAPWLRQASAPITPISHANPPEAPWYADAMASRQSAQAEMVRQWKASQEAKAAEAAAAAERDRLLHAGDDNRSGWVRFRDDEFRPFADRYEGSAIEDILSGGTAGIARRSGLK